MKSALITTIAAAAMLIAAQAPASANMAGLKAATDANAATMIHKTGRRGGRIAAGVALGVLGIIAASQAARAAHRRDYYEDSHDRRCRQWRRDCRDGSDRACYKYDTRC